jgi:outer membrane immunogenic protein
MRGLAIAAVGALTLGLAPQVGSAADIPVAVPAKAPVMAPPSAQPWRGFFIGIHGGYAWGNQAVNFAALGPFYALDVGANIPFSLAGKPRGAMAGIQWGTNYQFGSFVLGTASDFAWSDVKRSETLTLTGLGLTRINSAEQRMKWFGTTRLRGGFLPTDNVLLYVTGGLASGTAEVNVSHLAVGLPCAVAGACPAGSYSRTRFGWTAGGGIEIASGPWSFFAEYLHYDLGTANFAYTDPAGAGFLLASTRFSGELVRGGVQYRFDWTPLDLILGR